MGLVQYPFFILLIALQPVMNQPEIVPTFKYHSVMKDKTVISNDVTDENLGINIFQILSKESVVVFELVNEYRACRVYLWFGPKSEFKQKRKAVKFAADIIANLSRSNYCATFRVIREIPNHETDDFKQSFNVEILSAPPRRLYMVKGNNKVVIKQVPPYITRYNLNDVFVLHSEKGIHKFIGSGANENEKRVALKLVEHIKKHDMTDYSSAKGEEIIDWEKISQEGAPAENEKWLTFISMFHNGKKYFLENGIPEYHEKTDSEYESLRYSKIKTKIYNNTDGKSTSIPNLSITNLLKKKDEHIYRLTDSLNLKTVMVYIGKYSSAVAIKEALVMAEKLNSEKYYQVTLHRMPSFHTEFIINFKDYRIYLAY